MPNLWNHRKAACNGEATLSYTGNQRILTKQRLWLLRILSTGLRPLALRATEEAVESTAKPLAKGVLQMWCQRIRTTRGQTKLSMSALAWGGWNPVP